MPMADIDRLIKLASFAATEWPPRQFHLLRWPGPQVVTNTTPQMGGVERNLKKSSVPGHDAWPCQAETNKLLQKCSFVHRLLRLGTVLVWRSNVDHK